MFHGKKQSHTCNSSKTWQTGKCKTKKKQKKNYNVIIDVACSCYPVRDPLSLDQKTHCSGRASFRETERQGGGKKRINPFLRKISGCPFRVGCGWSSFLSHIFLCQWLDPWCTASLPWAARCTALCSSHPASLPILHRLYGELLRRDKEIPLFFWHGVCNQSKTALCASTNEKRHFWAGKIISAGHQSADIISETSNVTGQGAG